MEHNDIIKALNDLITTCKDGEQGFAACSRHAGSDEIRDLFVVRSEQCRHAAEELQNLVRQHGGQADDSGSALGVLQRSWVNVLGTVAGNSDARMLEEAERAEDVALAQYRKALSHADLPSVISSVVQRQLVGVESNHAQIKALRDRARAEA